MFVVIQFRIVNIPSVTCNIHGTTVQSTYFLWLWDFIVFLMGGGGGDEAHLNNV
jgi:hypothetical protein